VDASLFGRPGPRMGQAVRYLAYRLHGIAMVETPGSTDEKQSGQAPVKTPAAASF